MFHFAPRTRANAITAFAETIAEQTGCPWETACITADAWARVNGWFA
jgi:hypothetical protein